MKNKDFENESLQSTNEICQDLASENKTKQTDKALNLPLKPFCFKDVFVYAILSFLVLILFVSFVFPSSCAKNKSSGFKVFINNELALTYLTIENEVKIEDEFSSFIEVEKGDNSVLVNVFFNDEKTDFNTIVFSKAEKSAKITQSTCSTSKDCVFSPAIKTNGSIFCAPHNLKIVPLSGSGQTPPITG